MPDLPHGTVTFMFTDVEISTQLWDRAPGAMSDAMARHDELLRNAVAGNGGRLVKGTGDGVHAVFVTPADAVQAAITAQLAMVTTTWELEEPLRIRIGIHTGVAEVRDGDYFGTPVNRAARLMTAAHGCQIVLSLATEELVRDSLAEDVDLVDLGEHRLRGLERPERIFQVCHPSLPWAFPPLRTDRSATQLPVVLTSFVGRERELASLQTALEQSRVVTVIGVGGVGKTRLALHVARQIAANFRDGAAFCELVRVTDRSAVTEFVASVLDVPLEPGQAPLPSVLDLLRARQMLLVFDNCEHVVDVAGSLAETIVHECPRVTVLATSREALGIDGELLRPVGSLELPRHDARPAEVMATASVQLFCDRAHAIRPEFAMDDDNASVVADICSQLDGVPLAIELAAARMGSFGVDEIARRLDQRFRLLTGGRRTALERHQTLRAAVDWSYDLLDPVDARLFNRLAVFVGGFTADAAEAVAGGVGIDVDVGLEVLGGLVARSMVVSEQIGGGTRFRLHETMRQYARERLDASGESEAIRRQHAEFYVGVAEMTMHGLKGANVASWSSVYDREAANIDAALDWAVGADDADLALRLALALIGRPGLSNMMRALRRVISMPSARDHALRLEALAYSGVPALVESGDFAVAAAQLHAVDDAFAEAGIELSAPAYFSHAVLASSAGDLPSMMHYIEAAMTAADAAGDQFLTGFYGATGSTVVASAGDFETAADLARRARVVGAELGNATLLGLADLAAAYAASDQDPEAAIPALRSAVTSLRALGDQTIRYTGERCLARLLARRGDIGESAQISLDVLDEALRIGARMQVLLTCESVAVDCTVAKRYDVAATIFGALERSVRTRPRNSLVPTSAAIVELQGVLGRDGYEAIAERGRTMSDDAMVKFTRDALLELVAADPHPVAESPWGS